MSIGSLWLPRSRKLELTKQFRALRESVGLRGEIKWSKVSAKKLEAYRRLVDYFFDLPDLRFRVIVVDQSKVDVRRFHGGDRELGFYKFYFDMLEKWIEPGNRYLILLDFKRNKGADRHGTLRRVLENKSKGKAWIDDLTVIDSRESPLAQLNDLLTGSVAATWCELKPSGAKEQLSAYVAARRGASLKTATASPAICKFNLFAIALEPAKPE